MSPSSPRVLLVNMPWALVDWPSIQLGILKSSLQNHGIEAEVVYLNLLFAAKLGLPQYYDLAVHPSLGFLREWLFSGLIQSDEDSDSNQDSDYISDFRRRYLQKLGTINAEWRDDPALVLGDGYLERLLAVKNEIIPEFITEALNRINFTNYDIIGFTCNYNQTIPSLALSRRIKEKSPDKIIVMGGSNLEGEMGIGYLNSFPWIDCCVHGEGEETLPQLVKVLREESSLGPPKDLDLPGISYRLDSGVMTNPARQALDNLDHSPLPDYDDYFEQKAEIEKQHHATIAASIPYESARGCWWGQKNPCTFCGLNLSRRRFRSKSARRALQDIVCLAARYKNLNLVSVDNVLNLDYFNDLIPTLRNLNLDFSFFYELRADLKKEQIKLLAESGTKGIQLGIESFHSDILKTMRKGTTAIQNVQILKWCLEFGINVCYNFLYGFPGESARQYQEMADLMRALVHLPPPNYPPGRMMVERFSPYFANAESFGITGVRPARDYQYLHPSGVDLDRIAYFFDSALEGHSGDFGYVAPLTLLVKTWRDKYFSENRPVLAFCRGPGFIRLYDTRKSQLEVSLLEGISADIYLFCDGIQSLKAINGYARERQQGEYRHDVVTENLEYFLEKKLMIREGNKYLSLANPKKSITWYDFGEVL